MRFVIAQLLGLMAWFTDVTSYWFKNKKKILYVQVIADVFFVCHYCFLGALVGAVTCFICLIREILFYLVNSRKEENLVYYFAVFLYIIVGVMCANTVIEWLPILAEIIYSYALINDEESIVVGGIIDSIYWIVYGIVINSYACVITDVIVIISNWIVLQRKNKEIKKLIKENKTVH